MNCDRCGKEISVPQYMYEVFLLCPDCYEKTKKELRGRNMEIELIKTEVREDDPSGETAHLWFEAVINGKTYGTTMILCDPANFTKSMWQGVGMHISEQWETWAKKNNIKW